MSGEEHYTFNILFQVKASKKQKRPYDDSIELLRKYHDQSTGVSILLLENLYNYS